MTMQHMGPWARTVGVTAVLLLAPLAAPAAPDPAPAAQADDLLVVDCLLPGQIRKLGKMVYAGARRAIKTTGVDCEIRGGEYVSYDRADYRTALNVWLPTAKEGNAEAQNYVGEIYEKGLGVEPDYAVAAAWYRKAAEQGYSRAQINLGYLYEKGLGVPQDAVAALNWYRRASGLTEDDLMFTSAAQAQAEQSQQEIAQLRGEVERRDQQLEAAQADLAGARERVQRDQRAIATLRGELERARADVEAARAAGGSGADVAALERTLAAKQEDLAARMRSLEEENRALARQRETLDSELDQAREHERLLREQLHAGAAQNQALREQLTKLETQLDGTRAEAARLRADNAARDEALARERADLEAARAAAQAGDAAEAARINALAKQLDQRARDLAAQQARASQLEQEAGRLRAQLEDLVPAPAAAPAPAPAAVTAAAKGPSIELIDPPLTLVRGVPSVQLLSAVEEREIVGRVQNAGELLSLVVNDKRQTLESNGLFRVKVPVSQARTPVRIAAVSKSGEKAQLDFTLMLPEGAAPRAAKSAPAGTDVKFGRYHALVIGNDRYTGFPNLVTAGTDAEEVAAILRERYGYQVKLLRNANRYDMLSALNSLRESLTEEDNLLIYYAGHGELDRVNQRGHWLPVDAEPDSTANWISNIAISDILNAMTARHILVVADSCYSGSMTRAAMSSIGGGLSPVARAKWLKVMAQTRSRTVLTSGGLKPVLDGGGGRHSVFAAAFLDVLRGNGQILDGQALYREVQQRVKSAAAKLDMDQDPLYAPIRYAGHEAGEFFFVPADASIATYLP